jgi:positive regulator of sigma E activity
LIYFGPLAFVPMILVGVLLDYLIFKTNGTVTIVFLSLASLFYIPGFVMSFSFSRRKRKRKAALLRS